jgi:dolichyl-phosphate-mannose-protein mannosyltransferase
MSTPNNTLRQRGPKDKNKPATNGVREDDDSAIKKAMDELNKNAPSGELDYKIALGVITVLAFVTRFFGINHPNEVVFDEVHFGKVRQITTSHRAQI